MWRVSKCEQVALWHFSSTVISRRSLLTHLSSTGVPALPGWAKHQLFFKHILDAHRQKPQRSSLCSQRASFIVWFSTMAVENSTLGSNCWLQIQALRLTCCVTLHRLLSLICKTEVVIGSLDSWTAWRRNGIVHGTSLVQSLVCIWPLGKSTDTTGPFPTVCPSVLRTSWGQSTIP